MRFTQMYLEDQKGREELTLRRGGQEEDSLRARNFRLAHGLGLRFRPAGEVQRQLVQRGHAAQVVLAQVGHGVQEALRALLQLGRQNLIEVILYKKKIDQHCLTALPLDQQGSSRRLCLLQKRMAQPEEALKAGSSLRMSSRP